jgi:hypothetical protein
MDSESPGHGSGLGDAVEAMCSGVWGIDQASFRLTDDEDGCLMERRTLKSARDEMVPENWHDTFG